MNERDILVKQSLDKITKEYWWREYSIVGGYDVGKRGNPSHCSIFAIADDDNESPIGQVQDKLVMIHQKFLDGWDYTRQVDYLTAVVDYFNVQKLYYDNTRGELEERFLPNQCVPIILSNRTGPKAKGKMELATNFAKLVEQKRIELIDNDRFLSQILCVTGDLQAPNTPSGHGDSFISVMLAVGAYYDYFASDRPMGTTSIGNLQDIVSLGSKPRQNQLSSFDKTKLENVCKVCGSNNFETIPGGIRKICKKCFTIW